MEAIGSTVEHSLKYGSIYAALMSIFVLAALRYDPKIFMTTTSGNQAAIWTDVSKGEAWPKADGRLLNSRPIACTTGDITAD
jgi:hypothetical protein